MAATKEFFDDNLTAGMRQVARSILEERTRRGRRDFTRAMGEGISFSKTPLRARGMCLRADLDGFSKAVADAFKNQKVPEFFATVLDR